MKFHKHLLQSSNDGTEVLQKTLAARQTKAALLERLFAAVSCCAALVAR